MANINLILKYRNSSTTLLASHLSQDMAFILCISYYLCIHAGFILESSPLTKLSRIMAVIVFAEKNSKKKKKNSNWMLD